MIYKYQVSIACITKDGSEIRELMHPASHQNKNQSLAEARVPQGTKTLLYKPLMSEEQAAAAHPSRQGPV